MSDTLAGVELHWGGGREWMWNYCVYLGGYTRVDGAVFDLGVYLGGARGATFAIVYGPEDGEYISGPCNSYYAGEEEVRKETVKRARVLGLI